MIHDHITSASNYTFPNPLLGKGLAFLQSAEAAKLPIGRFEIDGDRLFALVQEYSTKPAKDCFWEAHQKFIDIQFISAGVEEIGYAPLPDMKVLEPYDPTKEMTKLTGSGSILKLTAGMFAVFFPHDAHMPCMAAGGVISPVRKIVMKVAVSK